MALGGAFPVNAANEIKWQIRMDTKDSPADIFGYSGEEKDLIFSDYIGGLPTNHIYQKAFLQQPLNSVQLPSTLKSIGDYAFRECGLKEVKFGESIETISAHAFYINNLTWVDIPPSVTTIGTLAFANNPNLIINLVGRSSTEGMTLEENWAGDATVVYDQPSAVTPPFENGDSANIAVEGTVEPVTSLNLDVPVKITFLINADRDFVTAPFQIINHSPMPVKVSAASIAASEGTSAKVVEHDAYTNEEWNNLSAGETQSKIALGLLVADSSTILGGAEQEPKWFGAEGSSGILELGTIKSAHGLLDADEPPALSLEFQAKYGKLWGDVTTLSYDMILSFSAE